MQWLPIFLVALMLAAAAQTALAAGEDGGGGPSRQGLRLWLDAADEKTVAAGADGLITRWLDKSGSDHHAAAGDGDAARPRLVPGAINGRAAVRFAGKAHLRVPEIRRERGDVTVFVVSRRLPEQASDEPWQRLLSAWDGQTKDDNVLPSLYVLFPESGAGTAYETTVVDAAFHGVTIPAMTIGASSRWPVQYLRGDVAELLVYDRPFLTEDEFQGVIKYLAGKWGAAVAREASGWTRVGGLGPTPERRTDKLPLSDQDNAGRWARYEPMTDEFDGDALDAAKWLPRIPTWKGRQPALFWDKNVAVRGGQLHLTMRKQEAPDTPRDEGYHTYTSAAVSSVGRVRYGYFEVRAKPMRSAGSSSFWFFTIEPDQWTEIDVFEIGGGAPGFERKYNMNAHVFHTPTDKRHWNKGGVWLAPWDLAADYHVYGLEWTERELTFHVDGVPVRRQENTHWHQPLNLIFDSETMPTWLGLPRDEDLPSTYSIDYVRAWRRAE
jgi:hypothetical protein